jgi:pyruvate dehydrogenase E2 component (dihydrolipoamide acetyltransferase)
MIYEVVMPQLGLTMEEGTVVSWQKQMGGWVEKGEILFTLETDKAAMEVEAADSGYLNLTLVEIGRTVSVGTVIAILGDQPGEVPSELRATALPLTSSAVARETTPRASRSLALQVSDASDHGARPESLQTEQIAVSPRARHLADKLGIDISSVKPKRGHRIVEKDILRFEESRKGTLGTAQAKQVEGSVDRAFVTRNIVARRMTESFQKAPHFYLGVAVNATELVNFREHLRKDLDQHNGQRFTYTDLFLRALSIALKEHPDVNAYWDTEGVRLRDSIDVGFAVGTPDGLVVPVIRKADQLNLFDLARQRNALTEKAKSGKLHLQDLEGGSATLSNLGSYGVDWFQAILNPPQSIILATGQIAKRATVVNDSICVCPTVVLSLSVDHRVLDGVAAAHFLSRVKKLIEDPRALLL